MKKMDSCDLEEESSRRGGCKCKNYKAPMSLLCSSSRKPSVSQGKELEGQVEDDMGEENSLDPGQQNSPLESRV